MSYRKYLMTDDVPPSELYKTVKIDTDSDTISRQAAIDAILGITPMRNTIPLDSAIFNIKKLPSADVQPVVRCKDCRHRYLDKKYGFRCDLDTGDPFEEGRSAENDDWFCADGIKMNGEQND